MTLLVPVFDEFHFHLGHHYVLGLVFASLVKARLNGPVIKCFVTWLEINVKP